MIIFVAMDFESIEDGSVPKLESLKFTFLNVGDIAKQLGKLYEGTKKSDKKSGARLISSFIYLTSFIKGWEKELTNKFLASCCGLKTEGEVSAYRKKHHLYWEQSERYRIRIKLTLEGMEKIELKKRMRYESKWTPNQSWEDN